MPVLDQQKALEFYTQKLGFSVKQDEPVGEHRWLTVVAEQNAATVELLLEPMAFEPARVYQQALFDVGIPITMFASDDLAAEVALLRERGVEFKGEIMEMPNVKLIHFEDTCGNILALAEQIDTGNS
ncbi:VOC family protein [Reinekea thalattae]|uniref:VOC family protein n=1 Tax=Reinekea thalattae TaxID=2593301 RepID=A0A5C8Z9I7_9GAMM|nr:VOC family protein [Reinekea thalattae]TXR53888.1 VOC family protein [Reinekea thalattae]